MQIIYGGPMFNLNLLNVINLSFFSVFLFCHSAHATECQEGLVCNEKNECTKKLICREVSTDGKPLSSQKGLETKNVDTKKTENKSDIPLAEEPIPTHEETVLKEERRFHLELLGSYHWINPKDINQVVREDTDYIRSQGYSGARALSFKNAAGFAIQGGYSVQPSMEVGFSLASLEKTLEIATSAGGLSLNTEYKISANILDAYLKYYLNPPGSFRFFIEPHLGIARFKGDYTASGTALTDGTAFNKHSAYGGILSLKVGTKIQVSKLIAFRIGGGYLIAESENLKVDSEKNTTIAAGGKIVTDSGSSVKMDFSGLFLEGGLIFSF